MIRMMQISPMILMNLIILMILMILSWLMIRMMQISPMILMNLIRSVRFLLRVTRKIFEPYGPKKLYKI